MGQKKLAFDEVAYILPSDILFLILIKVPSVKSLLRFKSISKSWNIIISDNEFKRTHRDQSKALGREKLGTNANGCVFWSYYNCVVGVTSTIIYFDGKSDELKELPLPDFVREDDCFGLTTLKSCLSFYGGNDKSLVLDIWIMERDGSWKWLMRVCNLPCICEKL
ncbi:hypothetical protein T459_34836 [Capsicum annuum]|uniref:F-box domain-containing protein n=1 Tax=Capsicum annuum TaxID=4072 RepID=A0A2G2XV04_CAPAN|nr:hypothetical protein T459_34836 [Capsicum annuum]